MLLFIIYYGHTYLVIIVTMIAFVIIVTMIAFGISEFPGLIPLSELLTLVDALYFSFFVLVLIGVSASFVIIIKVLINLNDS